jgi:hypothetical protein
MKKKRAAHLFLPTNFKKFGTTLWSSCAVFYFLWIYEQRECPNFVVPAICGVY